MQAQDALGNPTWLVDPTHYNFYLNYSAVNQTLAVLRAVITITAWNGCVGGREGRGR